MFSLWGWGFGPVGWLWPLLGIHNAAMYSKGHEGPSFSHTQTPTFLAKHQHPATNMVLQQTRPSTSNNHTSPNKHCSQTSPVSKKHSFSNSVLSHQCLTLSSSQNLPINTNILKQTQAFFNGVHKHLTKSQHSSQPRFFHLLPSWFSEHFVTRVHVGPTATKKNANRLSMLC